MAVDIIQESIKDKYRPHNIETTQMFSLKGLSTSARVVDVLDGDTLHIVMEIFNAFYKFSVRMDGIDTCELKSKELQNNKLANKARDRLIELVLGTEYANEAQQCKQDKKTLKTFLKDNIVIVFVECQHFDKFARLLATVKKTDLDAEKTFSQLLIEENLAYDYHGKKKLTEIEQVQALFKSNS